MGLIARRNTGLSASHPVFRRQADVNKAERQIGFKAKVSLEEGLRRLVQWWSRETKTPVPGLQ